MKEHIVQFGVGIDDDAIIRAVESSAKNQIINDIKVEVLNKVFEPKYYGNKAVSVSGGEVKVDKYASLTSFAENIIREMMVEHKEEIIDRAAVMLANGYKRTKTFKEKVVDIESKS